MDAVSAVTQLFFSLSTCYPCASLYSNQTITTWECKRPSEHQTEANSDVGGVVRGEAAKTCWKSPRTRPALYLANKTPPTDSNLVGTPRVRGKRHCYEGS
ncbi:hypothetical protein CGRA01v4_14517 [Colletotrichum graminicola]|nr:hypothetical protein CGRA01v4_14517 [Colletotrichum graminicola]